MEMGRGRQPGVPFWGLTLSALSRWGSLREPILEPRGGSEGLRRHRGELEDPVRA